MAACACVAVSSVHSHVSILGRGGAIGGADRTVLGGGGRSVICGALIIRRAGQWVFGEISVISGCCVVAHLHTCAADM